MRLVLARVPMVWGNAILVLLAALPSFGAAPQLPKVEAQVLEHGELLCSNCFFGTSDYYYCFKAEDRILIGRQRIPTVNYQDRHKNLLTKYRKSWNSWKPSGDKVSLSYDEKYIWVPGAEGMKDIRLTQDYERDLFESGGQCRAAVKKVLK